MASLVDPEIKTAFATADWEQYLAGRPAYPASLRKLVLEYSAAKGGGRHRMVDIGAGVGVASLGFLREFDIVHISDPSPVNTAKAPQFIQQWLAHQSENFKTKVETSTSIGEEAHKHIAPQSADLVICGTAAHFMDVDGLIESAARILKPGGTLAIFTYIFCRFPGKSEAFNRALSDCLSHIMSESVPPGNDMARNIFTRVARNLTAGGVGLDFVPLKPEFFAHPVRYRFNADAPARAQTRYIFDRMELDFEPFPSRVRSDEPQHDCFTPADADADGWTMTTTKEWLYTVLDTMRGSGRRFVEEEKNVEPYKSWEAAFAKECPEGTIETVFPAALVMATRR